MFEGKIVQLFMIMLLSKFVKIDCFYDGRVDNLLNNQGHLNNLESRFFVENNTWICQDTEFLFECSTQYLT